MDADNHFSKYGDVAYADKENSKYPIDTKEHVKAAWSYINMPKNAGKYDSSKLAAIKNNIKSAATKYNITISSESAVEKAGNDGKEITKTMSATQSRLIPNAYGSEPDQMDTLRDSRLIPNAYGSEPDHMDTLRDYMNQQIEKITTEEGVDVAEQKKRLMALLAELLGVGRIPAAEGPITNKNNATPLQFAAGVSALDERVKVLETERAENIKRYEAMEKNSLIKQAVKDGKPITFSADTIAITPLAALKDIVNNIPKNKVPMKPETRLFNADQKSPVVPTLDDSARLINELIANKS